MTTSYRSLFCCFFSFVIIFFSTLGCSSLEENRIEYQTSLGFSLTADQAKTLRYSYFELGYHDDILLRKTFKNNKVQNMYSEYFNLSSSKIDSIKEQIDFFSSKKTGNGSRIVFGLSTAIFTSVDTYTDYEIQEKEFYGKSIIRNEMYLLVNGKSVAFKEQTQLNMNDELNANSYGMNDDTSFYKFYYNLKGELILFCDYANEQCHVCKPSVLDVPVRLVTFPVEDFDQLKRAYFPFEDISYLKDGTLKPSSSYVSNLQQRTDDKAQYKTEIGTKISKESLDLLSVYDHFTYTAEGFPKRIERYENGELLKVTYFLGKNESEENIQQQFNDIENYAIAKRYEVKEGTLEVLNHYKNDTFIMKEVKTLDKQQRVIAEGKYEVGKEKDYSKNIRMYYDDERNITLIFFYKSNGDIESVSYQKNGLVINSGNILIRQWWKSKFYLFPNEDMDFYRTGFL